MTCPDCDGYGVEIVSSYDADGEETYTRPCQECRGSGEIEDGYVETY